MPRNPCEVGAHAGAYRWVLRIGPGIPHRIVRLEQARREANYMLNERGRTRETDRLVQHVRSQPRFGLARVG